MPIEYNGGAADKGKSEPPGERLGVYHTDRPPEGYAKELTDDEIRLTPEYAALKEQFEDWYTRPREPGDNKFTLALPTSELKQLAAKLFLSDCLSNAALKGVEFVYAEAGKKAASGLSGWENTKPDQGAETEHVGKVPPSVERLVTSVLPEPPELLDDAEVNPERLTKLLSEWEQYFAKYSALVKATTDEGDRRVYETEANYCQQVVSQIKARLAAAEAVSTPPKVEAGEPDMERDRNRREVFDFLLQQNLKGITPDQMEEWYIFHSESAPRYSDIAYMQKNPAWADTVRSFIADVRSGAVNPAQLMYYEMLLAQPGISLEPAQEGKPDKVVLTGLNEHGQVVALDREEVERRLAKAPPEVFARFYFGGKPRLTAFKQADLHAFQDLDAGVSTLLLERMGWLAKDRGRGPKPIFPGTHQDNTFDAGFFDGIVFVPRSDLHLDKSGRPLGGGTEKVSVVVDNHQYGRTPETSVAQYLYKVFSEGPDESRRLPKSEALAALVQTTVDDDNAHLIETREQFEGKAKVVPPGASPMEKGQWEVAPSYLTYRGLGRYLADAETRLRFIEYVYGLPEFKELPTADKYQLLLNREITPQEIKRFKIGAQAKAGFKSGSEVQQETVSKAKAALDRPLQELVRQGTVIRTKFGNLVVNFRGFEDALAAGHDAVFAYGFDGMLSYDAMNGTFLVNVRDRSVDLSKELTLPQGVPVRGALWIKPLDAKEVTVKLPQILAALGMPGEPQGKLREYLDLEAKIEARRRNIVAGLEYEVRQRDILSHMAGPAQVAELEDMTRIAMSEYRRMVYGYRRNQQGLLPVTHSAGTKFGPAAKFNLAASEAVHGFSTYLDQEIMSQLPADAPRASRLEDDPRYPIVEQGLIRKWEALHGSRYEKGSKVLRAESYGYLMGTEGSRQLVADIKNWFRVYQMDDYNFYTDAEGKRIFANPDDDPKVQDYRRAVLLKAAQAMEHEPKARTKAQKAARLKKYYGIVAEIEKAAWAELSSSYPEKARVYRGKVKVIEEAPITGVAQPQRPETAKVGPEVKPTPPAVPEQPPAGEPGMWINEVPAAPPAQAPIFEVQPPAAEPEPSAKLEKSWTDPDTGLIFTRELTAQERDVVGKLKEKLTANLKPKLVQYLVQRDYQALVGQPAELRKLLESAEFQSKAVVALKQLVGSTKVRALMSESLAKDFNLPVRSSDKPQ